MEIDLVRYSSEIFDFLSARTLREIDYGVLDLSKVRITSLKRYSIS